jgi:hypothetical protein
MNPDLKQDILYHIRHNFVKEIEFSDIHYIYKLYNKKGKCILSVEVFDTDFPRAILKIKKIYSTTINHFARTEEQFDNNYDIWQILSKLALKFSEQNGICHSTMNEHELKASKFLHNSYTRKR